MRGGELTVRELLADRVLRRWRSPNFRGLGRMLPSQEDLTRDGSELQGFGSHIEFEEPILSGPAVRTPNRVEPSSRPRAHKS